MAQEELNEVASLNARRAGKFLNRLRDLPFVTLIFDGDQIRVYTKDMDPLHVQLVKDLVAEIQEGGVNG